MHDVRTDKCVEKPVSRAQIVQQTFHAQFAAACLKESLINNKCITTLNALLEIGASLDPRDILIRQLALTLCLKKDSLKALFYLH